MRKVCNQDRSARGFSWSARRASGRSPVHAPPFSAARRAMRFDRGGVDGQSHAVLAAAGERFKDCPPMPALGPAIEPIVDRRVRTIVGRAIAPARAALKHVNDTADNASIVIASRPGLVRWQMRLYLSPLLVVQPEQSFAHPSPPAPESTQRQGIRASQLGTDRNSGAARRSGVTRVRYRGVRARVLSAEPTHSAAEIDASEPAHGKHL